MRNLLIATGVALLGLGAGACTEGPGVIADPPVLTITSPQRSLVQSGAGQITVTGTATPNADGAAIAKVLVNDVQAVVDANGNFSAIVSVQPGATLIKTVARDAAGGEATDTRAVQAGELRTAGATIDSAIAVAINTASFAKISAAGSTLVKGLDLGSMLAPMNPMIHKGDEAGEDCLYGRVWIDDVNMDDFKLSLIPTNGGITFRAEITGLDVPGHARYAAACVDGSNTLRVRASKVVIGGTLLVSPKASGGFQTKLDNPQVTLQGLDISASGIPGSVLDLLDLDTTIQGVLAKGAELAMEPMMNQAMGALAGPKTLNVMGHEMTMEVTPSDIVFVDGGGMVAMNTSLVIAGAEKAKFIYTPNGDPSLDMTSGVQLALADDFANEMLSEANALGMLTISQPATGATFDTTDLSMTMPPMISADPADGKLKVIVGDALATFKSHGIAIGQAALNVKLDIKVEPAPGNGLGVAITLGNPQIEVNVLDTITNDTRMDPDDLEAAVATVMKTQIAQMGQLLKAVPMPAIAGLQLKDLSVGADNGYVVIAGKLN